MTIRFNCSRCGHAFRVQSSSAGKRVKCECGQIDRVPEPNDFETKEEGEDEWLTRAASKRRSAPAKRRRHSTWTSNIDSKVWVGGAGVGLLLLLYFGVGVFRTSWTPDPVLYAELGSEQGLREYAVRLPRKAIFVDHRVGAENGGEQQIWRWACPQGEFRIDLFRHPHFRSISRPDIRTSGNVIVQYTAEPVWLLTGAEIKRGTVGSLAFTRVMLHRQRDGMQTIVGPAVDEFEYHCFYVGYDADTRIDIHASTNAPFDNQDFRVLEAAERTFRRTNPGETVAPPTPAISSPSAAGRQFARRPIKRPFANGGFADSAHPATAPAPSSTPPTAPTKEAATVPRPASGSQRTVGASKGSGSFGGDAEEDQVAKTGDVEWGDPAEKSPRIPLTNWAARVVVPDLPSRHIGIDQVVYDLETGEATGKIPVETDQSAKLALSPDGKLLAVAELTPTTDTLISIYSLDAGNVVSRISGKTGPAFRIEGLHFLAAGRLLARSWKDRGTAMIWDVAKEKLVKQFPMPASGEPAISSDGKYIAVPNVPELGVYDLASGRKVATMEVPSRLQGLSFALLGGLAFSPDNKELAALMNGARLVVWSSRGKITLDHVCAFEIRGQGPGQRLRWLPDGNAWLIGGPNLLERESRLFAWRAADLSGLYDGLPLIVLDQDHVVVAGSQGPPGGSYRKVAIPWNAIRPAVAAALEDKEAIIRPGQPMSLEFVIGQIRFSNPAEVTEQFTKLLTQRLTQDKYIVKPDQPIVLRVTYSEAAGGTKQVVTRNRQPTGQSITETTSKIEIAILIRGQAQPVWKKSRQYGAGLFIEGEVSDAGARKDMFQRVVTELTGLRLPTYIPKAPQATALPVVTELK